MGVPTKGERNMWTKEMFGTDIYHIIASFIIYSMLGWLVESIYMSVCNRKITNRGFAKGPFCPIYGFGGVVGYLILHPLEGKYIQLYIAGALIATLFEFLVGKLMLAAFGEIWWDYNEKPFNYKGIVCLESTIAWGFYAVIIIMFLNRKIMGFIDRYSYEAGTKVCAVLLILASFDLFFQLLQALGWNAGKYFEKIKEKYEMFRARWY